MTLQEECERERERMREQGHYIGAEDATFVLKVVLERREEAMQKEIDKLKFKVAELERMQMVRYGL